MTSMYVYTLTMLFEEYVYIFIITFGFALFIGFV